MPVRDPLGATAAALGRANGPREGARSAGWREVEGVERLEREREGGGEVVGPLRRPRSPGPG